VFVSTCESVNYFHKLVSSLNWSLFWDKESTNPALTIFKDKTFKLHGSVDHSERKITFEQFDKSENGVLFATDVASRGIDFKGVNWVL